MMHAAALPPFYANTAFYLYAFVWLPFALFVARYWTHSPWRATATGRAVMALAVSLTVVLTFVLVVLVAPRIPGPIRDALRAVCLGGVGFAGWLLFRNLLTEQKKGRRPAGAPRRRNTDI
jgi:hypothetical protein